MEDFKIILYVTFLAYIYRNFRRLIVNNFATGVVYARCVRHDWFSVSQSTGPILQTVDIFIHSRRVGGYLIFIDFLLNPT